MRYYQYRFSNLQEQVRTFISLSIVRNGGKSKMHSFSKAVNIECLHMQICANDITEIALTLDYSPILIDKNAHTYQLDTIGLHEQCIIADYLHNL